MSLELVHSRPFGLTVKTLGMLDRENIWFFVSKDMSFTFDAHVKMSDFLNLASDVLITPDGYHRCFGEETPAIAQSMPQWGMRFSFSDFEQTLLYVLRNTDLESDDPRFGFVHAVQHGSDNPSGLPNDERVAIIAAIKGLKVVPGWMPKHRRLA